MSTAPTYSKDEFARRGERLYERSIAPRLHAEDEDTYVAIDILSGDYAVDADEMAAAERLRERRPEAQVWLRRVGSRYARHYGSRRTW